MRAIISANHGIMTGTTDASWPDQLSAWALQRDPELHVVVRKYFEGPFPRFNWVKNQFMARSLANQLEAIMDENPSWPLWFIAHSNGSVISLLAAKLLIERGHRIGGLILTGAACDSDLARNGVRDWIWDGVLGAAIAYCSEDDAVVAGDASAPEEWYWKVRDWVWGKMMWPYGCLGRTGWTCEGTPIVGETGRRRNLFNRWYSGGHSCYFRPDRIRCTFEQMYQDMRFPTKSNGRKGYNSRTDQTAETR